MSETSARLGLPFIAPAQAQKHVTHNEALRLLDGITQLVLDGLGTDAPPAAPGDGEVHAVGSAPTGAWEGQEGWLAQWDGDAWHFILPQEGWRAWDKSAGRERVFQGGAWVQPVPELQNVPGIGINTGSDAANALAVSGAATLLSHAGTDHQLKINKAAPGDTASLLFQTGWSGRAEMGTAGTEDFAIKVSADGSTWTDALVVDRASGKVSGAAVQSGDTDETPGRLMVVGAFGLGSLTLPTIPDNDFDQQVVTGWSRGIGSASNAPRSSVGQMLTTVRGFSESFFQMSAIRQEDQVWFRRADTDGVPGTWREILHSGNIVGPLGVSTAHSIIEQGSNANGRYVRWADGTQICTHTLSFGSILAEGSGTYGDPYRTVATTWTLPASMISVDYAVSAAARRSPNTVGIRNALHVGGWFRSLGQLQGMQIFRTSSAGNDDTVEATLTAIGRWF